MECIWEVNLKKEEVVKEEINEGKTIITLKNDVKLHLGTSGGVEIMNEIDKGFPCHLILHSHKKYNDHSVFAIGYQLFYYNDINKPYDIFIRIADGWTSQPNRYVWGGCYGNWNYVTVHLK